MHRYTLKLDGCLWLSFDGVCCDLPGTNWTHEKLRRRVFRGTRSEALAYLKYVRTIYGQRVQLITIRAKYE